MITSSRILISLSVLVASIALALDTAAYRPSTLREASAQQPARDPKSNVSVSAVVLKYGVEVEYVEPPSSISEPIKEVLEMWGKIQPQNASFAAKFRQQIRVREGGTTYSLPIQDALVEPIQKEVRYGEKITLYVMWIGSTKTEQVFLINEFLAK